MRGIIFGMITGALLGLAQPAAADDANTCSSGFGDVAFAACNRAIASRQYSGHQLANLLNSRGTEYRLRGDLRRAMADYDEAIRLNPNDANAYNSRGDCWEAKGDLDRAIADYNQAIRLDPKFAVPFYNRGLIWERKHDLQKALSDLTKATELDRSAQNYQEAVERIKKALSGK
jgi:tetratricopeptide (TPR) repeat protein